MDRGLIRVCSGTSVSGGRDLAAERAAPHLSSRVRQDSTPRNPRRPFAGEKHRLTQNPLSISHAQSEQGRSVGRDATSLPSTGVNVQGWQQSPASFVESGLLLFLETMPTPTRWAICDHFSTKGESDNQADFPRSANSSPANRYRDGCFSRTVRFSGIAGCIPTNPTTDTVSTMR